MNGEVRARKMNGNKSCQWPYFCLKNCCQERNQNKNELNGCHANPQRDTSTLFGKSIKTDAVA